MWNWIGTRCFLRVVHRLKAFWDDGCRGQFQNAAELHHLHAGAVPMPPMAARLEDGFALQSLQDRLAARAGIGVQPEPVGTLRGYVDLAGANHACGWAQDIANPEDAVVVEVRVGGRPVLSVLANAFRADLRRAGLGSGCHAFDIGWDGAWPGATELRRACDGALLPFTALARQEPLPRAA